MTKSLPRPVHDAPPASRGLLLDVEGVQNKLAVTRPDGTSYVPSRWLVTHRIAQNYKVKIGRGVYWYEYDIDRWVAENTGVQK